MPLRTEKARSSPDPPSQVDQRAAQLSAAQERQQRREEQRARELESQKRKRVEAKRKEEERQEMEVGPGHLFLCRPRRKGGVAMP